jgi:hypothetical protein
MSFDIGTAATGAVGETAGAILGIGLGAYNDNRKDIMNRKIGRQNMELANEQTNYNMQKQLELWKATSYPAQMEQMKKAGINPGLMYGMGGGGGQTAAVAQGHNTGGGAENPGEAQAMAGMGIQAMQAQASIELMKAQARATNVHADKEAGVDTEKTKTETQSITQGIENQKAAQALTEAQTNLAKIQGEIQGGTIDEQMKKIVADSKTAIAQARSAMVEANIDEATQTAKITILKQQAIGAALDNMLKRTDLHLKAEEIKAIKESVINMNSLRQLKWQQEERAALHQQMKADGIDDNTSSIIDNVLNGIISLF